MGPRIYTKIQKNREVGKLELSNAVELGSEEEEARWSCVFGHDVWDDVGASLVDWFDLAGLEEVSDMMERETNVSAFGWNKWCLDELDGRLVVGEHLGGTGRREAEVCVEVSKVHEWFGTP